MKNTAFLRAADAAYDHLKTPYSNPNNKDNWQYITRDKQTIVRPNHGLAHTMRVTSYVPHVIDYIDKHIDKNTLLSKAKKEENGSTRPYSKQVEKEIRGFYHRIKTQEGLALETRRIELCALFSVTGRKHDAGWATNRTDYETFRQNSKDYFKDFVLNSPEHFALFNNDEKLVETYAEHLRDMGKAENHDPIHIAINMCHKMDLIRCWPMEQLKPGVFDYFNDYSDYPDNLDMAQLFHFAQRSIIATGDKLRTEYVNDGDRKPNRKLTTKSWQDMRPTLRDPANGMLNMAKGLIYQRGYQDKAFYACSTDPVACQEALATVSAPLIKPYLDLPEDKKDTREALALIKSGYAVSRLVNNHPEQNQISFELTRLHDPVFQRSVRPTHSTKALGDRSVYWDQRTNQVLKRGSKAHQSIQDAHQVKIDAPEQDEYWDQEGNPIARNQHMSDGHRGSAKATVFTKKISFCLIPQNGRFKPYTGLYSHMGSFLPVGLIFDYRLMHNKGERYIWKTDAKTNDAFWWGKQATEQQTHSQFADISQRGKGITFAELKRYTNNPNSGYKDKKNNEMLLGASLKGLKALQAPQDTLLSRLSLLHACVRIKVDYGWQCPMIIMDGEHDPKGYSEAQIKNDLMEVYQQGSAFEREIADGILGMITQSHKDKTTPCQMLLTTLNMNANIEIKERTPSTVSKGMAWMRHKAPSRIKATLRTLQSIGSSVAQAFRKKDRKPIKVTSNKPKREIRTASNLNHVRAIMPHTQDSKVKHAPSRLQRKNQQTTKKGARIKTSSRRLKQHPGRTHKHKKKK